MARDPTERFWEKVRRDDEDKCWEWQAARSGVGDYGYLWWNGKVARAHRVSWEIHYGAIPAGLHVCHACDNPVCCNPKHLFLGTQEENMRDCARKGRVRGGPTRGISFGGRLTLKEVQEIRRLIAMGQHFQKDIAARFGVSKTTISNINTETCWRARQS